MHPFLRAYMAGIALPTMVIPLVVAVVATQDATAFHLEDVVIFPIAIIPSAWGLWNVLYAAIRRQRDVPIGVFGIGLLLVLGPLGYAIQLALDKMLWTPALLSVGIPVAVVLYYLAWKHVVGRFNHILGVA